MHFCLLPTRIRPYNDRMSESIVRRVRLELPPTPGIAEPFRQQLTQLPYAKWLQAHVEEVFALTSDDGEQLLAGVQSTRCIQESSGILIFVTDFCFPNRHSFDYYNEKYVVAMRGRISESYPGAFEEAASPFKYKIGVKGAMEDSDFEALGIPESTEAVEVLARVGVMESC